MVLAVCATLNQVRQTFERLNLPKRKVSGEESNGTGISDVRFRHFVDKVYPKLCDSVQVGDSIYSFFFKKSVFMRLNSYGAPFFPFPQGGILLFVPSYFDFIRVKRYLDEHSASHALISEYTSQSDISKARMKFSGGEYKLLVITERYYFFRRHHIR